MSATVTTFRPLKPWAGWYHIKVFVPYRLVKLDPLYRGVLLWLREQALQAENDPSREWDGLRTEWGMLLAGTHPDPLSELVVNGNRLEKFDPKVIRDPYLSLSGWDRVAYGIALTNDPKFMGLDVPPKSQQYYAAISRAQVEGLLNRDTNSSQRFEPMWKTRLKQDQ